MGIYTLPIKNMRRNRIRNVSAIMRITIGVVILIILVSSGLGINSFLKQAEAFSGNNLTQNSNQTNNTSHQAPIFTAVVNYFNSTMGIDIRSSPIANNLINIIRGIIYFIDGLASIALLTGVLGVLTTMYFNEVERKREVGLLKTMGFTERQILLSLALEAALLGFIAAIIGAVLGTGGLFLLTRILGFISLELILPWWLIFAVILLTTLLSFILGIYPAWLASKNDVSVVFRNEQ